MEKLRRILKWLVAGVGALLLLSALLFSAAGLGFGAAGVGLPPPPPGRGAGLGAFGAAGAAG